MKPTQTHGAAAEVRAIQAMRRRAIVDGSWPAHSVAMWRDLADAAAARYHAGFSPSPRESLALELFPELVADEAAVA